METNYPAGPAALPLDTDRSGQQMPALEALYDRTVDAVKGFSKMVEKSEPEFRDTAESFRALHARHADGLARLQAQHGIAVDGEGSFMGTVNEMVVAFRAFFDDIDEDVMDQVRSGEDWVLKAFDDAIEEADGTDAASLREMQAELTALIEATQHID